jgi:anti-anti-sigma factor
VAIRDNDDLSRAVTPETVGRIFDEMPLTVVAFEGAELNVVAASRRFRELTGRSDLIGLPARTVLAEMTGQQILEIFERSYASGEPATLRDFRMNNAHRRTGPEVELFVDVTATPYRWPEGTVRGLIVDVVDGAHRVVRRRAEERPAAPESPPVPDMVATFQRAMMPADLPILPAVRTAATYLLAESGGGDWFDVLPLPDGRVALIVGDVVGHGVGACATMGQLRVLLREKLLAEPDPLAAVRSLDRMATRIAGARAATICVAVLDPATGLLFCCTAGHPAPAIVSEHGDARFLPATGNGPLGVGSTFTLGTDQLDVGDVALFYTDGILERPGRPMTQSTVELVRAATDTAAGRVFRDGDRSTVQRVCEQTLEVLTRATGHTDDIALLAAQRVVPGEDFVFQAATATAPGANGRVRRALGQWLAQLGAGPEDSHALQLVATELVTNAMEHGYADATEPGTVTVTARLTADSAVQMTVRDHGRWLHRPPGADRGRGLMIAAQVTDSLSVEHDDSGTSVTVLHRLSQPVRMLTDADAPFDIRPHTGRSPEPIFSLRESPTAPPYIHVTGPVDGDTADRLSTTVGKASAGASIPLTVDLTDVTQLASTGVAVLYQLTAASRHNGSRLRLHAPIGSPADMVLSLVGLPHTTQHPAGSGAQPTD